MIRLPIWLLGILALTLLVGFSTPLFATDNPSERGNQATETTKGQIRQVMADQHQFVLRDQNGKEWTFRVGQDNKVRLNDKDSDLANLKVGDEVTVSYRLLARGIQSGQANRSLDMTRGQIRQVAADQHQFTFRDQNGKEWTFHVGQDNKVRLNEKDGTLANLKEGEEVTITYDKQGDRLMALEICSDRSIQAAGIVRGEIKMVSPDNRQLILKDQNGKEQRFQVSRDAKVRLDNRDINLAELKGGQPAAVTFMLRADTIRSTRENK